MKYANIDTAIAQNCTSMSFEIFQNIHGNQICLEMIQQIVNDFEDKLSPAAACIESIIFITGMGEQFAPLSLTADPRLIRIRQALETDASPCDMMEATASIIRKG